MNAQISPLECDGFSFGKKTNRNGQFMLDMATACEFIICNTQEQWKVVDVHEPKLLQSPTWLYTMILILIPRKSADLLRLEKCSGVPAFDHDFNHLMKFDTSGF